MVHRRCDPALFEPHHAAQGAKRDQFGLGRGTGDPVRGGAGRDAAGGGAVAQIAGAGHRVHRRCAGFHEIRRAGIVGEGRGKIGVVADHAGIGLKDHAARAARGPACGLGSGPCILHLEPLDRPVCIAGRLIVAGPAPEGDIAAFGSASGGASGSASK